MSGNWITAHQTRIFMQSKQKENSQKVAAAQAGFSERSGYNINNRTSKSLRNQEGWKTRSDPFSKVWEEELVPLLETSPKLEARTLQRRVRQWRAVSGPAKEVIFLQNHPPGWQGISDFTNADNLGITIRTHIPAIVD